MSVSSSDLRPGLPVWFMGHKAVYVEYQGQGFHVVRMQSGPNIDKEVVCKLSALNYR